MAKLLPGIGNGMGPILPGAEVFVYWNLHRHCWSVRHQGKVIAHARSLTLEGASFCVSEAGRRRVLRERRKNVHAGARGTWVPETPLEPGVVRVGYNPYRAGEFEVREGEPRGVRGALRVWMGADGKVRALFSPVPD